MVPPQATLHYDDRLGGLHIRQQPFRWQMLGAVALGSWVSPGCCSEMVSRPSPRCSAWQYLGTAWSLGAVLTRSTPLPSGRCRPGLLCGRRGTDRADGARLGSRGGKRVSDPEDAGRAELTGLGPEAHAYGCAPGQRSHCERQARALRLKTQEGVVEERAGEVSQRHANQRVRGKWNPDSTRAQAVAYVRALRPKSSARRVA